MSNQSFLIKSIGCLTKNFPFFISRDRIDGYIPVHRHDFVEIEYTIAGKGIERINGLSHDLSVGNLSVLFPWDCHDLKADPKNPLCFLKLNFDIELFMVNTTPLYKLREIPFGTLKARSYVQVEGQDQRKIVDMFECLEREFTEEKQHKEMMFYLKIAEILVEFDRLRNRSEPNNELLNTNFLKIIEDIHQNYDKEICARSAAEKFRCSKEALNRLLEEHTRMSFDELVTDTRIRNACARLIYHTISIGQIAEETGFRSEDIFFKIFKRIKGISPANFRKKYKNPELNLYSPEDMDARIIYYIHCHHAENITLAQVAGAFHYSENYLCQIMKAQTGQSFSELLNEIRVFHAATRLLNSDDSVTEIGLDAGFQSNETFLRVFRRHYGCSPSVWRKTQRAD